VNEYKKFFYHFFKQSPTSIYTKTTILDSEAVSYLVIASSHKEIEPFQFKFPFVGEFPYIGFFSKESAESFASSLAKDKNLVTWVRPVFAYSTLGYFEDRILSSFFKFDDVELAELVFHELFHTIFFIKNEVDLNENLANFFGKELLKEYFKDRNELKDYLKTEEKISLRNQKIVELILILQNEFNKMGGFLTDQKADILTQRFVEEVFRPQIKNFCLEIDLSSKHCKIDEPWNQAAFAAFLTYEEEQDFLGHLYSSLKMNLKDFLAWIKQEYTLFKEQDKHESFTDYLKIKVKQ
jgi:predicted aminopeptidase